MADSNVVSIPQAVWIACNTPSLVSCIVGITFQYRKRYGLHAIGEILVADYNMSGFQYRKRYGLHAIIPSFPFKGCFVSFNTASGMDCMQYLQHLWLHYEVLVSIPQAVWIACNDRSGKQACIPFRFNTASGMDCMQYCLPEALETVSPEVGFLILTPFSHFSPKCAELFCREKCFERGLKPVIARALLSTKEI